MSTDVLGKYVTCIFWVEEETNMKQAAGRSGLHGVISHNNRKCHIIISELKNQDCCFAIIHGSNG
jgi:hypothetical protein